MSLYGGIEAGGTKFVCAVGTGPDDIRAEIRYDTEKPEDAISQAIDFFQSQQQNESLMAIGIASFGPIDPNPASETYGYITTTPKPSWAHTNMIGPIRDAFNLPVGFDTDVNGAALAEQKWGAAQGLDTFVYITVGTGIGGGAMVNGELVHGLMHPEMGHMLIAHNWDADPYAGFCPYHSDCWEGLAAGPALEERWETDPKTLPVDHNAWKLEAHYLALGLVNIVLVLSPQRIVMGGGVMEQQQLFPLIQTEVYSLLNGYIQHNEILENMDMFVVPPKLGNRAGVLGAIALAQNCVS
ncbi:ROK family protein [Chloroflexi bacterium TSY]|nr:ROK family protein [Chloroflexi bacterium TSY]